MKEKKMKKLTIILAMLMLTVISLNAEQIVFNENDRAAASNIQGTIEVWDEIQQEWVPAAYEQVTVQLMYDAEHGGEEFESETITTDNLGHYYYNFSDRYHNHEYCDEVRVYFRGSMYVSYYDGIERVDIQWYKSF
jgi:hypothetical protein